MPNGFDKNWIRLCGAVEGFYVTYGKWPLRVLLFESAIENLKTSVFSPESYARLIEKLELVAAPEPMVAQDQEGNAYSYGASGVPKQPPAVRAQEWLGVYPDGPGMRWG